MWSIKTKACIRQKDRCGIKRTEKRTSSPMDFAILTPTIERASINGLGSGFPRLAAVYTGSVSEKACTPCSKYTVHQCGVYRPQRVEQLASQGVLLLTPVAGAKSDRALDYLQAIETSETLNHYQKQRKTAIEPVFAVMLELAAIDSNQKQCQSVGLTMCVPFCCLRWYYFNSQ